jgi:hypothetical protein
MAEMSLKALARRLGSVCGAFMGGTASPSSPRSDEAPLVSVVVIVVACAVCFSRCVCVCYLSGEEDFFFFFCMNLQILCVEGELKKRFRCCFFGLVSKTHSRFTGAVP